MTRSDHDEPNSANGLADAGPLGYSSPAVQRTSEVTNAPAGRVDLAVIAVRVLAIWCFFAAVPVLFTLPLLFAPDLPWSYRLSASAPYAISLGIGVGLWVAAGGLARWMLAGVPPVAREPASETSRLPVAEIQAICFSVAGAVLAVRALQYLPLAFVPLQDSNGTIEGPGVDRRYLLQFALEAAGGVGLFFGARGLSNLWQRVRTAPDAPRPHWSAPGPASDVIEPDPPGRS